MVSWPAPLIREIAERRVVVFIGAGISKSAAPALPSWPALIGDLSKNLSSKKDQKLVNQLVRSDRLLDAAELINSVISAAERRNFLEQKFLLAPPPTSEIYKDILNLDFKVCITTNYDQLIEKNFEHFSGGHVTHHVRTYSYKNFIADLRSPSRTILKLHGCVTNTAEIVLDRKSYFNAKADNPGIYDAVQALSTVNTVLFLGYSISDPDIQLILESVHARTRTDHTHYALMSKFEHPTLRQAIGATYNVSFIEYPTGQHHEVPSAIADLWKAVKEERAGRGIP